MYNKKLTLSNGVEIPQLGLGTWFIDDDKVADAVKAAADLGYRHFDTAQAYGNERGVGEGIRTCGIPREKLFVVSKVAAEHKTYEDAKASIDKTLSDIGLDYLDMMIIHSPQPWVEVNQSDDRYVEGNRAAWKALEEAYKEGKLKAIGVSNFQIGDIESLLETCEIKPMVNQILLHISNTLQLGAISLPKTGNPEHMKTNADVDFEISAEDMEVLKNFKHIESYGESSGFPVYGGKL